MASQKRRSNRSTQNTASEDEVEEPPRKRQQTTEETLVGESDDDNDNTNNNDDTIILEEEGDENVFPSSSHRRRNRRPQSSKVSQLSQAMDTNDMENVVVAGQVKEIELENFMCHSNLKIKFDASTYNCFYIVGPNGSGKSAIFAGLNIGLGGKGKANNRGNAISSYIKEGESTAKIRVHLSNIGANRHSQYDDEIIVERIIRQNSSTYSLKSVDGLGKQTSVSTSKKDLDNLLKKFSIELENPLCWLSQDRAREFLQDMKPNKLYEIFMITSELCLVNLHHDATNEQLQEMQILLENWRDRQKTMKDNFERLKQVAESTGKIIALKSELSKCTWISLWIPMKINFQNREKIDTTVTVLQEDIQKVDVQINNRVEESAELQITITNMQQSWDSLNQEIVNNKVEIRKLKDSQSADSFKSREIAAEISRCRTKLKNHDAEIDEATKTLESVLGRADRDIYSEKSELEQKIKDDRNHLKQLKEQKDTLADQKRDIESGRQVLLDNILDCDSQVRNNQSEINKIDREKREHERNANDQMAKFGESTTSILKCIEDNASKFHKKPIGPVGLYVKLQDKKWEDGVEFVFKNFLKTYICDNANDRKALDDLLAKHKIRSVPVAIVNYSDRKYNTVEIDRDIITVARQVIIDNATVYNFLVDSCKMERIMLIEVEEEGRERMKTNPPANISHAITSRASQIYPVSATRPYRFYTGGYRARIMCDVSNFDEEDANRKKGAFQEEIKEVEKRIAEIHQQERKMKKTLEDLSKQSQDNAIETNKLEKGISCCEDEVQKLESIATRELLVDNAKKIIEELKSLKSKDEEILQAVLRKQEENTAVYDKQGEKIQEIVNQGKDLAQKMVKVENELEKLRSEFDAFDKGTGKLHTKKRLHEARIIKQNELKKDLLAEKEILLVNLADAEKYEKPDNMNDPPDFDALIEKDDCEKQIAKLKSDISRLTRINEGRTVTVEELEAAKLEYEKASETEKQYSKKLKKVEKAFHKREELFTKVKGELPIKLRQKFCDLMNMRNYVGHLNVDHENKTIEIKVETHRDANKGNWEDSGEDEDARGRRLSAAAVSNRKTQRIAQDLKGLSGGERSYTTACFVMALWSCLESPFRCLDEFDVFMDMVNRKIIMGLLSDLARQHKHIQFFFFTPQGVSELQAKDVEVFTMAPARR